MLCTETNVTVDTLQRYIDIDFVSRYSFLSRIVHSLRFQISDQNIFSHAACLAFVQHDIGEYPS